MDKSEIAKHFNAELQKELDKHAEEMEFRMKSFRENGKQVAPKQWDVDFLVAYVGEHGCAVEQDNDGQIVMYPDLYEAPDGTLWKLEK